MTIKQRSGIVLLYICDLISKWQMSRRLKRFKKALDQFSY